MHDKFFAHDSKLNEHNTRLEALEKELEKLKQNLKGNNTIENCAQRSEQSSLKGE